VSCPFDTNAPGQPQRSIHPTSTCLSDVSLHVAMDAATCGFRRYAWIGREDVEAMREDAWIEHANAWWRKHLLRPYVDEGRKETHPGEGESPRPEEHVQATMQSWLPLERILQEQSLYAEETGRGILQETEFERDVQRTIPRRSKFDGSESPVEISFETSVIQDAMECMERQERCAGASSIPEPYLGFLQGTHAEGTWHVMEITPFRSHQHNSNTTRCQRFHQGLYQQWIQRLKCKIEEPNVDAKETITIGGLLVRSGVGLHLPPELQTVLESTQQEGSQPCLTDRAAVPGYVVVMDALRSRRGHPSMEVYSLLNQEEILFECA